MEGRGRPLATLVVGAACISFAPILVKVLMHGGLGPTAIGFWRCALGTVVLAGLARVRGASLRLPRRAAWFAVAAGVVFFADLSVWHRSIRDAGAGLATILGNMQVFLTALLSWWLFRERIGARFVLAAVAAIAGVVLLVGLGSGVELSGAYLRGVALGLLTAVLYATFLLAMRAAGGGSGGGSTLTIMTWMSASATVPLGLLSWVEGGLALPVGSGAWSAVIGLAILAQSFGWWSISRALPLVPGATAGLLLLLQPVLATVWGVVLFDESMTLLQGVGAIVTLAAIYAGSRRPARAALTMKSPA